ncbi:MAG TPA: hypothetical protein VLJ86_27975 [Ramlibacter sp.]|nr:hypothetical protein [Ramlibacter sp.]
MSAAHTLQGRRSLVSFTATALLAVAATAQVATIDNSGNYRQELQSCMSGQTAQDRDTCLREARNAQAERQRGTLGEADRQYQANALARCDAFKAADDKSACQARVMGQGQISGSVAGGGILRQYEMTVPGEVAPASATGAMGAGPGSLPPTSVTPSSTPLPSPAAGPTSDTPPGAATGATNPLGAPPLQPGPASGLAPLPAPTR